MKGLSMHQAFRRSEYWREYVETFGKEALHVFAVFHFQEWLAENHPPRPADAEPPVLTATELRRLARAAVAAGRRPEDVPILLLAGEAEHRWRIPVRAEILTPGYWQRRRDLGARAA